MKDILRCACPIIERVLLAILCGHDIIKLTLEHFNFFSCPG